MAEVDQRRGDGLDERCRAADEDPRSVSRWERPTRQLVAVDPAGLPPPVRRDLSGEGDRCLRAEDVATEYVGMRPRRVQQAQGRRAVLSTVVVDHGQEGGDAGPPGHELHRTPSVLATGPVGSRRPHEVAPDGTAQLQDVVPPHLVGEVRRHLTSVEALHGQVQLGKLGRGGEGVAALGHVAVLGREPDDHVLAGQVSWPAWHVEDQPVDPRGLRPILQDCGAAPGQSPLYRCSRHGSPWLW
jgi:hypothetical protein